jgi:hypothetical protein
MHILSRCHFGARWRVFLSGFTIANRTWPRDRPVGTSWRIREFGEGTYRWSGWALPPNVTVRLSSKVRLAPSGNHVKLNTYRAGCCSSGLPEFYGTRIEPSQREVRATVRSGRAGINPAPTQGVGEPRVGAGFTPARIGCRNLEIAQIRWEGVK